MFTNIELIVWGAIIVLSLIQFVKTNFLANVSTRLWAVSSPMLCIIIALVSALLPAWAYTALKMFAVTQLGYENLIQPIKRFLNGGIAQVSKEKV